MIILFLQRIQLKKHQISVFDKGYTDYAAYDHFTTNDIFFVTRLKSNTVYISGEELDIPSYSDEGVLKDEIIETEVKENGKYV